MTVNEIREKLKRSGTETILVEIAAQLAELNQNFKHDRNGPELAGIGEEVAQIKQQLVGLNEKFVDFFATQLPEWAPEKQDK